jgi:hypothetical protein
MQCTADELSRYVSEGRVFHIIHSDNVSHRIKLRTAFIQTQRESPPQEIHQIEALGGTLYSMLSIIYPTYYVGFDVEEMRFIIRICMKHIDIPYFVVCVLQIIYTCISCVSIQKITPILVDIYSFLTVLTTYHREARIQRKKTYWEIDITRTWEMLFILYPNTCSTFFFDNPGTVYAFLEILKCKPRGSILASKYTSSPSDVLLNNIIVREGLQSIFRDCDEELCFCHVYCNLFKRNYACFSHKITEQWPFIFGEDHQLLDRSAILRILHTTNKEENYPKSANKH